MSTRVLFRRGRVKYDPCRRFSGDRRTKKAWTVYEYRDENNEEYRRAFWADRNASVTEFDLIATHILTEGEPE